jgi:large subunit ribosomal protein L24
VKIKKGDRVQVLSGKDRGKTGEVMRVLPKVNKVLVAGVNIAKRHTRAQGNTMQGGIIDKDMPLPASNVAVICSKDGPTRVRYTFDDKGEKKRVCAKCGGDL